MSGIVLRKLHILTHLIHKNSVELWYLSLNTYKCSLIHETYSLGLQGRLDSHIFMKNK